VSESKSFPVALLVSIVVLSLTASARIHARSSQASKAVVRTGAELYEAACAACHGGDGTGVPPAVLGFDTPVPDFADCSFSSVEPDLDWLAIVHDGGPVRGFDRRMPAFGEALTEAEILRTIDHIHTFCDSSGWPRGELNLPRALVTEKAFPENETVVTTRVGGGASGVVVNELLYERRFGVRNQFEVAVPFTVRESRAGQWSRGLGDVALAVKRAMFHSLRSGTIVSVAGEVVLPTGKEDLGLGGGVTMFEPFVAFGQILPRNFFVHAQAGAELAAHRDKAEHETFWRVTLGTTIEQGRFGRAWSPMIEVLQARELKASMPAEWDVVPQMQVTLNKRQHLMINAGVRIPITGRDEGRRSQVITYFLWDWFDGSLVDGW
jgi:hypothetical protein